MSKQLITKNKILDAAEMLFAEHGFGETSLRTITAKAEVNLASVNYHFGSKKSLIEAVFERFMDEFTAQLMREMTQLETSNQTTKLSVESVLAVLIRPIVSLDQLRPNGASVFMQLLGKAYAESQGHMRRFAMQKYQHVLARFTRLLHKANPELSPSQMFWRLHFMLGAFIFTLAGHEALQEISSSDFNEEVDIEQIIIRLIPFLAGGFSTANTVTSQISAGEA